MVGARRWLAEQAAAGQLLQHVHAGMSDTREADPAAASQGVHRQGQGDAGSSSSANGRINSSSSGGSSEGISAHGQEGEVEVVGALALMAADEQGSSSHAHGSSSSSSSDRPAGRSKGMQAPPPVANIVFMGMVSVVGCMLLSCSPQCHILCAISHTSPQSQTSVIRHFITSCATYTGCR